MRNTVKANEEGMQRKILALRSELKSMANEEGMQHEIPALKSDLNCKANEEAWNVKFRHSNLNLRARKIYLQSWQAKST